MHTIIYIANIKYNRHRWVYRMKEPTRVRNEHEQSAYCHVYKFECKHWKHRSQCWHVCVGSSALRIFILIILFLRSKRMIEANISTYVCRYRRDIYVRLCVDVDRRHSTADPQYESVHGKCIFHQIYAYAIHYKWIIIHMSR